jgi:hypothetical protein
MVMARSVRIYRTALYEAYRDNRHETLISVGLAWGIGHSGARSVGADAPNTI